jgi:hypothetical protein
MTLVDSYPTPFFVYSFIAIDKSSGNYLVGTGQNTTSLSSPNYLTPISAQLNEWNFVWFSIMVPSDVIGFFGIQNSTSSASNVMVPTASFGFFDFPSSSLVVGAGYSTNDTQGCGEISSVFVISYYSDSNLAAYIFTTNLLGFLEYRLLIDEQLGQYLFDSTTQYTTAFLGNSSATDVFDPQWQLEGGLNFSNTSFVSLPNVNFSQNMNYSSISISVWIFAQHNSTCSTPYIYRRQNETSTLFGIFLRPINSSSTAVSLVVNSQQLNFSSGPSFGVWQNLVVSCSSYLMISKNVRCILYISSYGSSNYAEGPLMIKGTSLTQFQASTNTLGDSKCSFCGIMKDFRLYVESTALFQGTNQGIFGDNDPSDMLSYAIYLGPPNPHTSPLISFSPLLTCNQTNQTVDVSINECISKCQGGCLSCNSNATVCYVCPQDSYIYKNQCVSMCPTNFHVQGNTCITL